MLAPTAQLASKATLRKFVWCNHTMYDPCEGCIHKGADQIHLKYDFIEQTVTQKTTTN